MGACFTRLWCKNQTTDLDDCFSLAEIKIRNNRENSLDGLVSRNQILWKEQSNQSFKSSTAIMMGTLSCDIQPIAMDVPLINTMNSETEVEAKQSTRERITRFPKNSQSFPSITHARTPVNSNAATSFTLTTSQTLDNYTKKLNRLSPTYKLHEVEISPVFWSGNIGPNFKVELEDMTAKYYSILIDRDRLLAQNISLTKDLQKSRAQVTIQKNETKKLVMKAQRESAQWKEFATSAQTDNASLVKEVQMLKEKLELVDPENLEAVKQYRNLMNHLEKCKEMNKKLREQKLALEKRAGELAIKLEQEKLAAKITFEMRLGELSQNADRVENHNASLRQQVHGLSISLKNAQIETDISRSESKMLKWLLDEKRRNETFDDVVAKSPKVVTEGQIKQKTDEEESQSVIFQDISLDPLNKQHVLPSSVKDSKPPRKRALNMQSAAGKGCNSLSSLGNVEENMTEALSLVMSSTAKHQKEFQKLYEQYQLVVKERDEAVEKLDIMQHRFEKQLQNDVVDAVVDSDPETEDQNSNLKNISSETLVKKIELLEMELRHKTKIISYLERELRGQLKSSVNYNMNLSPLRKWELTRNEIFSGIDGEEESPDGEDGSINYDDEQQSKMISDVDAGDIESAVVSQVEINSEGEEKIHSVF